MDHDEVREQLELAATEPAGIDRLMAGDTPLAAAMAAHLAGCSSCTDELDRLRRAAIIIGDAVRTTPPPELRERTLAFVREVGRIRDPAPEVALAPVAPAGAAAPVAVAAATASTGSGRGLAWVGAIAAAVLIAVAATTFVLDRQATAQEELAAAQDETAGLAHVTAATLALAGEPDAENVRLAGTDDRWGRVVYSADKGELAVIASGLTEPAGDREYRCWVEIDGQRRPVGKMFFGGDLAFWAGPVETIDDLPAGAKFGVSLVDTDGTDVGEPPVLRGDVGE